MPTAPVDHGCDAAHSTALTTSACSPGPPQSRQPVDPITGVLSLADRFFGRSTSACSATPSVDGMDACVHAAPGGTSAAEVVAGSAAARARVMASARLMHA